MRRGTHLLPSARVSGEVAPALELREVRAAYERVEILRDLHLTVPSGKVVALLGPNGAGKTTTIRVASGRMRPTAGHILMNGVDVTRKGAPKLARGVVCCVPEGRGVFANLTVAENLRMWTFGSTLDYPHIEELAFARFPQLATRRRQLAGTLSGGEQQMLAMSRALATSSKLLLLDEISNGLAPMVVAELYELVAQLAADGYAILVVEQFAHAALRIADWAVVMAQGRIVSEGRPDEIRETLGDLYLQAGAGSSAVHQPAP